MKNYLIVTLLCLAVISGKGQVQYPIELPAYNLGSIAEYTIQAKVVGNNVYEYTIRKEGDPGTDTTFTLRPNSLDAFKRNVEEKFVALLNANANRAGLKSTFDLEKGTALNLLYYQFIASETAIDSYDDRPIAGKIFFNKEVDVTPVHTWQVRKKINEWITFKLDSARARIENRKPGNRPSGGHLETVFNTMKVSSTSTGKFRIDFVRNFLADLSYDEAAQALETALSAPYKVEQVEIEFNEGFIENIKVVVQNKVGNVLKFENAYPIGFSSKRDIEWLYRTDLFAKDVSETYVIGLADVIDRYEQKHEVNRRDYSPANETMTFTFQEYPDGVVTLRKETTAKLFELKTFSDFVGFEQSSPNGLIQVEIEKRMNLVTHRKKLLFSKRVGFGLFQYLTPFLLISKLEENNKYLLLNTRDQFVNNQYHPMKLAPTLELKRFENFSVGADLNIFLIDFPSSKFTASLNSGIRYGRVSVRDSVRVFEDSELRNNGFVREFGINTFQIMPSKATVEFKTDERYSMDFSWSLNLLLLRDNYFTQVANIPSFEFGDELRGVRENMYHNVAIGTSFRPSSSGPGRLFFRYRYNWQQGYWRTGFHQAQVGFSVFLTKTLRPEESN